MQKWTQDDMPDQAGRIAIVTGASTGIGYETARALAHKGAAVTLACRSRETAAARIAPASRTKQGFERGELARGRRQGYRLSRRVRARSRAALAPTAITAASTLNRMSRGSKSRPGRTARCLDAAPIRIR